MNKGIWEETIRENANKKGVGLCDRCEEGVCAEEREGISVVKGGKGGSTAELEVIK